MYILPEVSKGFTSLKMLRDDTDIHSEIPSDNFVACDDGLIFLDNDDLIMMKTKEENNC